MGKHVSTEPDNRPQNPLPNVTPKHRAGGTVAPIR